MSSKKTAASLNLTQIPVVDRPCLALVRQCRKKKNFSCIAVLVRDIVGQQLERVKKENKFPRKQKPTRTNTPTKQSNTHKQTRQRSREICKLGETGETSASLSSPSQVLFRQVVLPHVVHVRCLPYQCLHQDTQASLEHLVDVAV